MVKTGAIWSLPRPMRIFRTWFFIKSSLLKLTIQRYFRVQTDLEVVGRWVRWAFAMTY